MAPPPRISHLLFLLLSASLNPFSLLTPSSSVSAQLSSALEEAGSSSSSNMDWDWISSKSPHRIPPGMLSSYLDHQSQAAADDDDSTSTSKGGKDSSSDSSSSGSSGDSSSNDGSGKQPSENWFPNLVDHFPNDPKYAPHPISSSNLSSSPNNNNGDSPSTSDLLPSDGKPDGSDKKSSSGNGGIDPNDESIWMQRFWYEKKWYRKGGPVILYDQGESEGSPSWLEPGSLINVIMQATGGVGIVLEHRFYGKSFPTKNLTTDSLRFLDLKQGLADNAYFALHLQIPELKKQGIDIRAPGTPWIIYGGSYPGAKAAFSRTLYPGIFFGSIASSAVTHAEVDMYQYYDTARHYLPSKCSAYVVAHTAAIDRVLAAGNAEMTKALETMFGLEKVTADLDFVAALVQAMETWQSAAQGGEFDGTWNPSKNHFGPTLDQLCANVTSNAVSGSKAESYFDKGSGLLDTMKEIMSSPDGTVVSQFKSAGIGYDGGNGKKVSSDMVDDMLASFALYAGFQKGYLNTICSGDAVASCWDQDSNAIASMTDTSQWGAKSWQWQYCSEFGFFHTSAPTDTPSLVSRLINVTSVQTQCNNNFPPGDFNKLPAEPNVTAVNQYGDFNISFPRLAFVGGEMDPWRPVSPQVDGAKLINNTEQPAVVIQDAGHVWDINTASADHESKSLYRSQTYVVNAVKNWISKDWPKARDNLTSTTAAAGGVSHIANAVTFNPTTDAERQIAAEPLPPATDTTNISKLRTSAQPTKKQGLSKGAKIGIAVGAAIGVALLISAIIAAIFWFRRRRSGGYVQTRGGQAGATTGQKSKELNLAPPEMVQATNSTGRSWFGRKKQAYFPIGGNREAPTVGIYPGFGEGGGGYGSMGKENV